MENLGRLLATLERTGQADNTVFIFTSDNGGLATAEGSPTEWHRACLRARPRCVWGEGAATSLFAGPGVVAPGTTCQVSITSPDFYPTLLEMAGFEPIPEQRVDGVA